MQDFPQSPWFLKHCFGGPAPADTLIANCQGMTAENINEYVAKFDIPFAHLKPIGDSLNDASKERVAKYTPELDTILWLVHSAMAVWPIR